MFSDDVGILGNSTCTPTISGGSLELDKLARCVGRVILRRVGPGEIRQRPLPIVSGPCFYRVSSYLTKYHKSLKGGIGCSVHARLWASSV